MLRVLVVNDNRDVADSMCLLLNAMGNDAVCAYSGADALTAIPTHRPHLAFVDIAMSDMDGWETARRIRALPDGESLALVALTGYGQEKHKRKSEEAGFDCHLVKPLEQEVLAALLDGVAHVVH